MNTSDYQKKIILAYEAEVSGISYFKTLANLYTEPAAKHSLNKIALVEEITAAALRPIIDQQQLSTVSDELLLLRGIEEAKAEAIIDWQHMMSQFLLEYTPYVVIYEHLFNAAPKQDTAIMAQLLWHEKAIVSFLELSLKAKPAEAELALDKYLQQYPS